LIPIAAAVVARQSNCTQGQEMVWRRKWAWIRGQRSEYRPRPVDHSICASERTRRRPCQGILYL